MNMKELVELFGGKYLFGGALIQFGEESFKEMYKQIYDAAMLTEREECAKLCETLWNTPENGMATEEEAYGAQCAAAIRARTDHDPAREQE